MRRSGATIRQRRGCALVFAAALAAAWAAGDVAVGRLRRSAPAGSPCRIARASPSAAGRGRPASAAARRAARRGRVPPARARARRRPRSGAGADRGAAAALASSSCRSPGTRAPLADRIRPATCSRRRRSPGRVDARRHRCRNVLPARRRPCSRRSGSFPSPRPRRRRADLRAGPGARDGAAARIAGRDAVFLVVPLFAALAVWLTFLLGRRAGRRRDRARRGGAAGVQPDLPCISPCSR